jgi:hypothetical protein
MVEKQKNSICNVHSKEIDNLKDDYEKIQTEINKINTSLVILMDKVNPLFTTTNKITIILALLGYAFISISFINRVSTQTQDNNKDIILIKEDRELTNKKIDKIYELVSQTNIDVAVLKAEKNNK